MVWIVVVALAVVGLIAFARYAMKTARVAQNGGAPAPTRTPSLGPAERNAFNAAWRNYERSKARGVG